jgi:hypothetical protein
MLIWICTWCDHRIETPDTVTVDRVPKCVHCGGTFYIGGVSGTKISKPSRPRK